MKFPQIKCDVCRQLIAEPKHGWVEWLSQGVEERQNRGLRIVHHFPYSPRVKEGVSKDLQDGCQYNEEVEYAQDKSLVNDTYLEEFLGPDGLMDLLSFISEKKFSDVEEVLQVIKRLHIPGYEEAHRHFGEALSEGVFEPNTPSGYYSQKNIEAVLAWLKKRESE